MRDDPKAFKGVPKKYQPHGMTILFEDRDIIVVDKVSGLLTMSTESEREKTAYSLLTNYVRKGVHRSRNRIFIVHRLDRDTSGVLVFAKSEDAKRYLQDEWHDFKKTYYAVVRGALVEKEGVITSYLAENKAYKVFSVKGPEQGKFASTGYKVLRESQRFSLLEIDLHTGRKNQIRVHLAEKGHSVVGDEKYGIKEKGVNRLALHATAITLSHPHTHQLMTFEAPAPEYFRILMK